MVLYGGSSSLSIASAGHYDTGPADEGQFETHRVYADLQYVISGRELMGWSPPDLRPRGGYDPQKDITFFDPPSEPTLIQMDPGCFGIFLPTDAHMPGKHRVAGSRVHKVVVKLRYEPGQGENRGS